MRPKKIITVLFLSFFWSGFFLATPTLALSVDEVAKDLICTCGCGKMLNACEMESAKQMKVLIGEMIDQGQDRNQILSYFVEQYGESVLAAPTKRGFNLTAWVIPFVAMGIAVGVIYFVMAKWVLKGKTRKRRGKKTHPGPEEDKYTRKLKKELKEFDF